MAVPKVMGKDADGRAIIGGVRFNMPGWWELKVHVD
ncbi:MAG: Auxin-binding protein, partial [Hyphomicrobiales bacterium]